MPTATFLDTNIWLYALITGQDVTKAQRAYKLITHYAAAILVSTQVINEVCVNLIRHEQFTPAQTRDVILDYYARFPVIALGHTILVHATQLREQYHFSYWDSLIVASARAGQATLLFSEDMHNGLVVDQHLTIINPFSSMYTLPHP